MTSSSACDEAVLTEKFATHAPDAHGVPHAGIRVGPATPADVRDIASLFVARNGGDLAEAIEGITRDLARMDRQDADRWVCVAHIHGAPHGTPAFAGYARVGRRPASPGVGWFLLGVIVEPGHRRCGVARALTTARLEWLADRGIAEVRSFVSAQNGPSVDLHRATGFQEVARGDVVPGTSLTGGIGILFERALP
ncbi:MAG: GNAT family N-acetyltransferase [Myxococcota bacterium]